MRRHVVRHNARLKDPRPAEPSGSSVVIDTAPGQPPIVLHVHVHGQPAEAPDAAAARPRLTGSLFSWRGHYNPLIKRHLAREEERNRPLWWRVGNLPGLRLLTLAVVYVMLRLSRGD